MSFTWNPVFNLVIKIKRDYISKHNDIDYNTYTYIDCNKTKKTITCLEHWVMDLNNKEYNDILSPLQINQLGKLLLIRYGRYSDVFNGENDVTNENFWDIYDGFYKECRSIVIDVDNEEIILSPFKKFRNLNEGEENNIENITEKIKTAECVEITNKLDGSMQSARYYDHKITMSGSQAIDHSTSWRLQDGYSLLMSQPNYIKMLEDFSDYTFIFEYISLKDAHVVNYKKEDEGLYVIGMRNVYTGNQLSYNKVKNIVNKYDVKMTEIFNKTFDEVMEDSKTLSSDKMEGYVLNVDGHLVKIKCDDYVQIHRVLSKISSINLIIESIAENRFDDLVSKVPETYRWRINKVAKLVLDYIKDTDVKVNGFFNLAPKTSKKDFMIWIDANVPIVFRGYVRNKYLNKNINYLKGGNEKCPSYKKLKDMGIDENYSAIFADKEVI